MSTLDFIFGILTLSSIIILFIGWLSTKYDVAGRAERKKQGYAS